MSDSLYPPGQINHLGSNGVDSHSARFYHEAHTPHSAVSSFNYPVRYDANLNTPVSIYGDSPVRQRETEAYGTSSRNSMNPELSFISNHGLSFIGGHSNSSAEMKAKTGHNRGPTPSIAGDTRQSWDAFLNDSPLTLAPPTHHFGSFSVSSPLESSMTSTPRSGVSMPTFTQAPILTQPNPQSIREKHGKRSYDDYDRTPLMNPQCQFMPQSSQNYLASSEMDRASGKSHQEHESLHIIPVPGYVKSEATPPPTVVIPSLHTPSVRQQSVASTTLSTDTSRKRRRTTNSPPMSQHSSKSYLHAYNQGVAFSTRPQETDVLTAMTEADLTVDERLLKELRDGGSRVRTWKETLLLFNAQAKKTASHEATLQMRYTRLNEKLRAWKEHEVQALLKVRANNPASGWEQIAVEMHKLHCVNPKWSNVACRRKWESLCPSTEGCKTIIDAEEDCERDEEELLQPTADANSQNLVVSGGTGDRGLGLDFGTHNDFRISRNAQQHSFQGAEWKRR